MHRGPGVPGAAFRGSVQALLPEVNMTTRTLKARVQFANPSGQLVPGLFVTMQFMDTRAGKALLVPTEWVIPDGPGEGASDACFVFYPARSSFREGLMRMLPAMVLPPKLYADGRGVRLMRTAIDGLFRPSLVRNFVDRMWGIVVILGKPKSRGTLKLASPRASDDALIDPSYLEHPDDVAVLLNGVAKARRIARRDVQPAAGHLGATGIQPDVTVTLGAERLPQHFLDVVVHRLAGYPPDDPAEHIGVRRHVMESVSVLALFLRSCPWLFHSYAFRLFFSHAPRATFLFVFFFNDTATTEIYTRSLVGSVRCV